ncbi:hypothetical protein DPMN_045349 [Dreissena polymorpha]|uniref:Uncharacterized protein n=1 Tax=Dreissena polymorpha TaxID=45954 RepID=A0A9D4D7M5_DREPO|nr:hypothetical protein DPMN_045349 [Dreissena polymorpha]
MVSSVQNAGKQLSDNTIVWVTNNVKSGADVSIVSHLTLQARYGSCAPFLSSDIAGSLWQLCPFSLI